MLVLSLMRFFVHHFPLQGHGRVLGVAEIRVPPWMSHQLITKPYEHLGFSRPCSRVLWQSSEGVLVTVLLPCKQHHRSSPWGHLITSLSWFVRIREMSPLLLRQVKVSINLRTLTNPVVSVKHHLINALYFD